MPSPSSPHPSPSSPSAPCSPVTAAAARHWLATHAHRRALARPLLVLVPPDDARQADVAAQGRRVFVNWRTLACIVDDVPAVPVTEVLEPHVPADADGAGGGEGDAYDLVAFDAAAARVRALPVDHALLGRAHHVLLANPRGGGRGTARGAVDRWLAAETVEPPQAPQLFPPRPGRPPSYVRAPTRPPRVRTLCVTRPFRADAAYVGLVSRWRDEPPEGALTLPRGAARWTRAHTTIVLAALFDRLVEVEAGSSASLRM